MLASDVSMRAPLYEKLASFLTRQIESHVFNPGDRIPSVREISRQQKLSVTTVLQAYRLLEDRGLIEARPQSGYYVRCTLALQPEPEVSAPPMDPHMVSVDELTMQVIHDTSNLSLVQFAAAVPSPDLLPTEKLNRLLASVARKGHPLQFACGTPQGAEELRVQIARRRVASGVSLSPNDIIITNGAMEAISLSLRALCQPGDLVAVESPTYFGILQALESQGLCALEIPTHYRDGISLEALAFALENHPVKACVVVTNFSNPLGSRMPDENKRALVEMLAEEDIPLIEDDLFGELYFSGDRPSVAKSYDTKGLVLLASSFTKELSPGYRLGWLAPGRYRDKIERIKMATNLGTAILPQIAVARYIAAGGYESHLRHIRRAYAQKSAGMQEAVTRYFPPGTRVTNPQGGFVLWVQLPEQVDSLDLYRAALRARITLAPGYIFSTTQKYRNFVRLNSAYFSPETLPAVQRLGEITHRLAR